MVGERKIAWVEDASRVHNHEGKVMALEDRGISVDWSCSVAEGLRNLGSREYPLVLVDPWLPFGSEELYDILADADSFGEGPEVFGKWAGGAYLIEELRDGKNKDSRIIAAGYFLPQGDEKCPGMCGKMTVAGADDYWCLLDLSLEDFVGAVMREGFGEGSS